MANMIARLGVVLGLDSAEFSKGLDAAGKKLEQFSQSAEKYGKIAATALVAASAAAVKYADDLADVAEANEVAIGTVLQLSEALANSGGKADNAGKMLSAFAKFIDEAAGGSEKAQKTAAMLGVSLKDLGKLSQEELLDKLVANLAKVEDPITRNAQAMEIFSKAAKGVDMVGFAEKMSKANPLIEEQEKAVKAAADTYDLLATTSRNVMLTLATELGPVLKATIDYIKSLAGETNLLGPIFKTVFQTIAITIADVSFVLGGLLRQMQLTATIFKSFIPSYGDEEFENAFGKKEIADIIARQDLDRFSNKILGVSEYGNSIDAMMNKGSSTSGKSGGRAVTDAGEKERQRKAEAAEKERLRQLEKYRQELQRLDKIMLDVEGKENNAFTDSLKRIENDERALRIKEGVLSLEIATQNMRSEDIQLVKDLYLAEEKRLQNIKEIERNNLLSEQTKKYLVSQENALANATERYLRAQNQAVKAQRDGTAQDGMMKQAQKFLRDMPTELEMGAKAFDSLMGNMESAIDKFVRTGKASFKDLAKSIIQDILAMQMKAMASRFLASLFGGGDMSQPAAVMGLPGYANGGNPAVGRPSIVGERGPELFVPRTAGTIIPNHALSGVGGVTNVTNNYINAIDTKSFEDRLLGSSTAIWAANKYGEKNLATNYGRT
jgi:lambda family phage tail tape measure protein